MSGAFCREIGKCFGVSQDRWITRKRKGKGTEAEGENVSCVRIGLVAISVGSIVLLILLSVHHYHSTSLIEVRDEADFSDLQNLASNPPTRQRDA